MKSLLSIAMFCVATTTWLVTSISLRAEATPGEEIYFTVDFNNPKLRAQIEAQGAKIVNKGPNSEPCLEITLTPDSEYATPGHGLLIPIPVDLRPLRDCQVVIEGLMQADNLSKPAHLYNGAKCQLTYKSSLLGTQYNDGGGIYGTFDWKKSSARLVVSADAERGRINLGMQECSGTLRITDVKIKILAHKPARPAPVAKLDQTKTQYRGFMSPNIPKADDFRDMRAWGANSVRWHLSGTPADAQDFETWSVAALDNLQKALDYAQANNIKVAIDLHLLPGGRLPDGTMRMVLEKKYQDQFIAFWQQLVTRFKGHPAIWAYDLINEPVQTVDSPKGVDSWMPLQMKTARLVRQIDPKTPIMIEVDGWDGPEGYNMLMPVDLPNVIYQVHMYWPGEFTHQGVHTDQGIALGKDVKRTAVTYPGLIGGKNVDKETLRTFLQPVREFQQSYNARIYVGEFSAVRWAPGAAQYLEDCIALFEEYGWDWSYHAFREWHGWSSEHDDQFWVKGTPNPQPTAEETDRAKVLKKAFQLNSTAPTTQTATK